MVITAISAYLQKYSRRYSQHHPERYDLEGFILLNDHTCLLQCVFQYFTGYKDMTANQLKSYHYNRHDTLYPGHQELIVQDCGNSRPAGLSHCKYSGNGNSELLIDGHLLSFVSCFDKCSNSSSETRGSSIDPYLLWTIENSYQLYAIRTRRRDDFNLGGGAGGGLQLMGTPTNISTSVYITRSLFFFCSAETEEDSTSQPELAVLAGTLPGLQHPVADTHERKEFLDALRRVLCAETIDYNWARETSHEHFLLLMEGFLPVFMPRNYQYCAHANYD